MTISDDIRAAIKADTALLQLAHDGDDSALARLISIRQPVDRALTTSDVMQEFGAVRGQAIMRVMRDVPDLSEVVRLMDGEGFSLSNTDAAVVVGAMVASASITTDEAKAIRRLSMATVHPTADQVSRALRSWRPRGNAKQLVMEELKR